MHTAIFDNTDTTLDQPGQVIGHDLLEVRKAVEERSKQEGFTNREKALRERAGKWEKAMSATEKEE